MRYMKALAATLIAAFMVVGLAGCLESLSKKDDPGWKYGDSYHTMFDNQKLNPQAGDAAPVEGLEGVKSNVIYDRYQQDKVGEQEKKSGLKMETTVTQ